ncbi:hypothetical protein Q4F19_00785 [Sphingomonas sp. BIUV-7]|uniref:Uncharacterized protein n=1 Tax=Sphingomonas natans TaxID=3063330 RepID=A0ABT8Y3M1_9SPHN|nr:hypothetical protein [Sphingomonas sp. BIUV-7]MDO6412907.1 hypothetical protein [Sphingomonas sp. BIUV-7]
MIPGFTAERLPVELVWSERFVTRIEAREAEKRLKGWSQAKKMALIRGDWDQVSWLARGKKDGPSTSSGRTVVRANPTPSLQPYLMPLRGFSAYQI